VQQLCFSQVAHVVSSAAAAQALLDVVPHWVSHFEKRHEKKPLEVVSVPEHVAQSCASVQDPKQASHVVSVWHDRVCEQHDCARHVSHGVAPACVEHCCDDPLDEQLDDVLPRRPPLLAPLEDPQLLLLLLFEEHPKSETTATQASAPSIRSTIPM
jgi:hypothetical protein